MNSGRFLMMLLKKVSLLKHWSYVSGNISAAWIGQRCYCSAVRDVSREGSQVWASANWGCHVCGVGTDKRSRGFLCAGCLEKVQPQIMRKTGISDLFVNYENIARSAWKCVIVQVMMLYLTINCVVEYWKIAVICKGISVKRWSWCWGSQGWIFVQNFGRIGKNWLKNCHVRKRAGSFRAGVNIPSTLVENWLI